MMYDDESELDIEDMDAVEDAIGSDEEEDKPTAQSAKSLAKAALESCDDDDEVELEEEHYFTEDPTWKGFRYFRLEQRIMYVNFSKFFNDSEDYEDFITSCVSKKAYHKMMRLFAHTNNVILNANPSVANSFIYRYYCIKYNIDNERYGVRTDHRNFVNALINLFDVDIINEIRKFVNTYYVPTGDVKYEQNKRTFVPSITFLDYHIKILYVVSCMTHFIIPLCLSYLRTYRETPTNALLVDSFTALFPLAQMVKPGVLEPLDQMEREVDVYQKLYAFVEAKVKDTLKSDEVMWERQAFLGVNYKTTIEDIVNKLVTNIIPEYNFGGNIMHLNVSVVRKSIQDYTLRKKDPFNINCFIDVDSNTSSDDNAVVTEAEQFDSYNAKHNELPIVIRHTFADDTINKIMMRKGISIDQSLVDYYYHHISFNEFQQFAIYAAFHRYFGGTDNMHGVNYIQWVKMALMTNEILMRNDIPELPKYIVGIRNKHYVSKMESRFVRTTLSQDPLYNYIITNKYRAIKNIILKKNNFIETRITYLTNNEFIYNTPDPAFNGKIIPRNDDEIRAGVLKFFATIVQ